MDTGDWRDELQPDTRQRVINRLRETLARHLTHSTGEEALLQELTKIAIKFEEKTYKAATSQANYLNRISLKILAMDTQKQNPLQFNGANPSDQGEAAARSIFESNLHNQSNEGSGKRLRLNEGGAHSVSTYESTHDSEGPHIPIPRPVSVTVAKDQVKRKGKTTPEVVADHEREKLKLKQLELEEKALGRKEKMLKRKNKMLICLINLGEKVTPQQAVIRDKLMAELYEAEP